MRLFRKKIKNIEPIPSVPERWEDVSLKKYCSLSEYISEQKPDDLTSFDTLLNIYSILMDIPVDSLSDVPVTELQPKLMGMSFVNSQYVPKTPEQRYSIEGRNYSIDLNVKHLTASQFIDFSNFSKDIQTNLKYIYLCFLIPEGHKYNEGYDVMELADELEDRIPITVVLDLFHFFQLTSEILLRIIRGSLMSTLKKTLKREKEETRRSQILEVLKQLQDLQSMAG